MGKFLAKQVTKESLEQAKGSIAEMIVVHDKLQDVYTRWFDKTNKIIEEHKEKRQHAATSGSGMSHKLVLGAFEQEISFPKAVQFEYMSQYLRQGCEANKVQRDYHSTKVED